MAPNTPIASATPIAAQVSARHRSCARSTPPISSTSASTGKTTLSVCSTEYQRRAFASGGDVTTGGVGWQMGGGQLRDGAQGRALHEALGRALETPRLHARIGEELISDRRVPVDVDDVALHPDPGHRRYREHARENNEARRDRLAHE